MWSAAVLAPAFPGRSRPATASPLFGEETQQRMEAEATLIGRGCLFLFRAAGNQCGVEVQNQAGKLSSADPDSRYALAGLGGLHPGDFPG